MTETMSPEERADLKAAAENATPGDWHVSGIAISSQGHGDICYLGEPAQYAGDTARGLPNAGPNRSYLIAAQPRVTLSLLASLEEAEGLIRDMVTAEDELIADLLEEGKQAEVLALDFPIMHRMRAHLARVSPSKS